MEQKVKDKVGIITGATSGMGKAIALELAAHGAKLVLSGRDKSKGTQLAEQLEHSVFVAGDITQPAANETLVHTALEKFGKLDFLSLNAGILGLGNVVDLSISTWNKTLETNLSSIFYLTKYALPFLSKNEGSSILINASIAAFKSFPNHPAYCASKAGAVGLMRQLAVDYAPIRVNALCPGPVDTPLLWASVKAFKNPELAVENAKNATLLKKLGTPEDIAKMALFLLCGDSSWITGSEFTIDGGILNS